MNYIRPDKQLFSSFLIVSYLLVNYILASDSLVLDRTQLLLIERTDPIDSLLDNEIQPSFIENSDTDQVEIIETKDLNISPLPEEDIFDAQLVEANSIFAEAVISDLTGDTLEGAYQFEMLFESLFNIEELSVNDEFKILEFNRLLTAAIDYYEDESVTIGMIETGFSVAVLKDKLNEYIYGQTLEDLEYVEQKVEIIPGHIPITYNQKVASIIKFFQNEGRESFQKWLNRMSRYKPIILPILEEEGVPPELFYLAMIESGLNPKAYSYAHASGVWQFISSTGKIYGLKKKLVD